MMPGAGGKGEARHRLGQLHQCRCVCVCVCVCARMCVHVYVCALEALGTQRVAGIAQGLGPKHK